MTQIGDTTDETTILSEDRVENIPERRIQTQEVRNLSNKTASIDESSENAADKTISSDLPVRNLDSPPSRTTLSDLIVGKVDKTTTKAPELKNEQSLIDGNSNKTLGDTSNASSLIDVPELIEEKETGDSAYIEDYDEAYLTDVLNNLETANGGVEESYDYSSPSQGEYSQEDDDYYEYQTYQDYAYTGDAYNFSGLTISKLDYSPTVWNAQNEFTRNVLSRVYLVFPGVIVGTLVGLLAWLMITVTLKCMSNVRKGCSDKESNVKTNNPVELNMKEQDSGAVVNISGESSVRSSSSSSPVETKIAELYENSKS